MNGNYPAHDGSHQNTPGESPLADYIGRYWASHHLCQQFGTEKLVYTGPQTNSPTSSPIESSLTLPEATSTKDYYCQFCSSSFHRWQDRDRHEQTHLPHFIHCPLPHCEWRGNRTHTFKTHWMQMDHRPYHKFYRRSPERSLIETYDPQLILDQLRSGIISHSQAEDRAIDSVQVKAYELQKPSMWVDPWGRSRKRASRDTYLSWNKKWARVL